MEVERKFLVAGDFRRHVTTSVRIVQGYLSSAPERSVRVRIRGDRGFLTVKGPGNHTGVSRFEWEQEIPLRDAEAMLALCEPGVIEKVRHLVPVGGHTYEVDEFRGANDGLLIAELELTAEDEPFERPDWLGPEVTGDPRYFNVSLAKRPYSTW